MAFSFPDFPCAKWFLLHRPLQKWDDLESKIEIQILWSTRCSTCLYIVHWNSYALLAPAGLWRSVLRALTIESAIQLVDRSCLSFLQRPSRLITAPDTPPSPCQKIGSYFFFVLVCVVFLGATALFCEACFFLFALPAALEVAPFILYGFPTSCPSTHRCASL